MSISGKLDLFICTDRDFNLPSVDESYKIIKLNQPNLTISNTGWMYVYDDTKLQNITPKHYGYSELSAIYWVWKNLETKKYVGFNHYNKYFDIQNFDAIEKIFEQYNIIVPVAVNLDKTVQDQYDFYHNIDDLLLIEEILKKEYPDYTEDYDKFIKNSNLLLPSNMFIMKREDYEKYCEFLFNILFKFDEKRKIETEEDIFNIYKNISETTENENLKFFEYQSKVHSFLGERLFTLYILHIPH